MISSIMSSRTLLVSRTSSMNVMSTVMYRTTTKSPTVAMTVVRVRAFSNNCEPVERIRGVLEAYRREQ